MKAAIYIRVSTAYQVDKDSLPMQRKDLIDYCKSVLNIKDYEVFEDAGYSAKNTDRPAFQEMMARIRNHEFSHILVWKIDRISRNLADFTRIWNEFQSLDVQFASKYDNIQTDTPAGRMLMNFLAAMAQMERETTAMRVQATMISRAKEGKWNGTACPLGYKYDYNIKYPVPDEEEKKLVQFIFDKYEEIESSNQIAKLLNESGVKSKRNGQWFPKTIVQILKNEFYVGTLLYNQRVSGRGKLKPKEEWIIIENNHEGIIDRVQFDRVQILLERHAAPHRRANRTKHTHIFSNLLICHRCGATFSASLDVKRKDGFQPSHYICASKKHSLGCQVAGCISDLFVGEFVLNYMKNMIAVQKAGLTDDAEIEKRLLQGPIFKNVAYISQESLDDFKKVLNVGYLASELKQQKPKAEPIESKSLKQRKAKLERALKRLDDLFLFADYTMTEKEYLTKKKSLMDELYKIDININKQNNIPAKSSTLFDNDLLDQYIIEVNLNDANYIVWKKFAKDLCKNTIASFFNDVIEKIVAGESNQILEITFKNGLSQRFLYR